MKKHNALFKILLAIIILSPGLTYAKNDSAIRKIESLETTFGGKIGVYAINTGNNKILAYRATERFPFASTGKVMVVAAVLKKSESDPALLNKKINYTQQDIDKAGYTPITEKYLSSGMTINDLCKAMIAYTDNGAMNLLTQFIGGPEKITAFARSIGDTTYRLDRLEPDLNTAIPHNERDTTSPQAMAISLQHLTLGNALSAPQQKLLISWLKDNTTGDTRIRAGVSKNWIVGDKTGKGEYGTNNDIAIIWPPHAAPIILAIYTTQNKKNAIAEDSVIASVTKIVIHYLS